MCSPHCALSFKINFFYASLMFSVAKAVHLNTRFLSVFFEYLMKGVKRELEIEIPKEHLDTLEEKIVNSMPPGPGGTVIQHMGYVEFSCIKPNTAR